LDQHIGLEVDYGTVNLVSQSLVLSQAHQTQWFLDRDHRLCSASALVPVSALRPLHHLGSKLWPRTGLDVPRRDSVSRRLDP